MDWLGKARHGSARQGNARQGKDLGGMMDITPERTIIGQVRRRGKVVAMIAVDDSLMVVRDGLKGRRKTPILAEAIPVADEDVVSVQVAYAES